MNYIELARKYNITNIDDAFENLLSSDLSRKERIKIIQLLRYSRKYLINACFRIVKDASHKDLIKHIFDREIIPKHILEERDKYIFQRLTRFEFIDRFAKWFNSSINELEYCFSDNKEDEYYSLDYFSFIAYLFHNVNHLCIKGDETGDEEHDPLNIIAYYANNEDDYCDNPEAVECKKLFDEAMSSFYNYHNYHIIYQDSSVKFITRDQYVNDKLKECINVFNLDKYDYIEILEKCEKFHVFEIDNIEIFEKFNKSKQYELILDFYSTTSVPHACIFCCESCCTDYYNPDYIDDYQCVCLNDPNISLIHCNSLCMAEKLYNMVKTNEMYDVRDLYTRWLPYYPGDFDKFNIKFPFFYGDEYLFKLCDNNEEIITKYLYDEMYKRIFEKLHRSE